MKKLILLLAVSLSLGGGSVFANEYSQDYRRVAYSPDRHNWMERHVNHLQRMLDHVRWEIRHYRADWRTRREVQDLSRDINRVTAKFRSGDYNRYRLRREVDRLHDRLHAIEERLHVRSRDYYRWD